MSDILERSKVKHIYIIQLSHLDIGFTGTQCEVAQISAETINRAIEFCHEHPDYKWTIESIWQLKQWTAGKSPEHIGELVSLVKAGRIGLTAGYAGILSATMGAEEFCRSLYPAEKLRREYGVTIETIIQNDIPGYSWAYPQILAKSGVKHFVTGTNHFIGKGAEIPWQDRPFWWEGPDGSRVLTYICHDPGINESGYLHGFWEHGWGPGGRAEQTVPEMLERLEDAGYPHDSVLIMSGTGDNANTFIGMVEGAREWNSKHSTPTMIICTPDEFFAHLREENAGPYPVYRGDWSGLWDQNAQVVPYGVSLSRRVHDELPQAEALASFAGVFGLKAYPKADLDTAWENVITFDEHSGGGGWPGTLTPEQTAEGNVVALGHAQTALDRTSSVHHASLEAISSSVRIEEDGILVWNPTAHSRSDVVRTGDLIIRADDLPGLGYRSYMSHTSHDPGVAAVPNSLENEHLRLEVGPDGMVASIRDKRTGRELVDGGSKYGFGQLVQATKLSSDSLPFNQPEIKAGQSHPLAASLIIEDAQCPLRRTEITLLAGEPIVRFRHTFDMTRTSHRTYDEGPIRYDVAYPLDILNGKLAFDTPAGMLDPDLDFMPKAHHIINVHHGGDVSGDECGVAFASPEAFMWEFGGINGLWGTAIPPESTPLMMRLLSKHDEASYKEGIGPVVTEPGAPQERIYEAVFMLHSGDDPSAVRRFMLDEANPLVAVPISANPKGILPESGQFLHVDGKDIVLLTLKQAEDGDGYIMRLMETSGSESDVTIRPGLLTIANPWLVDNVERPIRALTLDHGQVKLTLRPREIVTIRFNLEVHTCD